MKMIRMAVGLTLAAVLAGTTGGAAYADAPHSSPYTEDAPSHPRGPISGTVSSVDYGRGQMVVNSRGRAVVIVILPSTAIYRGGAYATLTDLQAGMHVDISASESDGNLIAQIIRIR